MPKVFEDLTRQMAESAGVSKVFEALNRTTSLSRAFGIDDAGVAALFDEVHRSISELIVEANDTASEHVARECSAGLAAMLAIAVVLNFLQALQHVHLLAAALQDAWRHLWSLHWALAQASPESAVTVALVDLLPLRALRTITEASEPTSATPLSEKSDASTRADIPLASG